VDVDPRWYEDFFGGDWLDIATSRAFEEATAAQVDFVVDVLDLGADSRVLDLACGHGRHALELARRGYAVAGLDLSAPSLALARDAAAHDRLEIAFNECDMREIPYDDEFDAVINLFTAFGYFESDGDDRRVLEGVARARRSGGGFLVDTIHPPWLYRHFEPHGWSELDDGTVFLEDRSLDLRRGRIDARWVGVRPDGARSELWSSVRLYTLADLAPMLADAGLEVERAFGGFDGSELGIDSRRMIVLARKR
jgi:SAM-dependent methyltransferase